MKVNIIVATGNNNEIGFENRMPWHMPADLQYFKEVTMNYPIIMGRKTYESIGRILPGRTNVIVSRNSTYQVEEAVHFSSIQAALDYFKRRNEEKVFIIGGGQVYKEAMAFCDVIYRTKIHADFPEATVFFPPFNHEFKLTSSENHQQNEKNPFDYSFERWDKSIV